MASQSILFEMELFFIKYWRFVDNFTCAFRDIVILEGNIQRPCPFQHNYVNVLRLIEMFSLICNMLRISTGACCVIILWHSLLMQPRRAILQSLIYHILQLFMGKSRLFQLFMHTVLCLSSFCGIRKEVHMEIREALSFYHSWVKYVTLQELLANNMQSLIRDSKKIAIKLRVVKNECQVWVELYRTYTQTHVSECAVKMCNT